MGNICISELFFWSRNKVGSGVDSEGVVEVSGSSGDVVSIVCGDCYLLYVRGFGKYVYVWKI